jgi:Ca-activated chloride channel family protein
MSVANLMPGDRIEVHLDYSELLVPEDGIYQLVYPTVVGPRYAGGADPAKDHWMANPHLAAGQPAPYRFDVGVHLETGMPLKAVSSPSHAIDVKYASASSADVKLREPGHGGDRDYVLRYRLADDKIETGLLLAPPQQPGGDGFFALMMEPPPRPTAKQIPSREYLFLLDVSGSMHGFPLETAKALMRKLLGQLKPSDELNVALFSGANYVMSPSGSVPATPANVAAAIALVEKQQGGGGTELMGGLEAVYKIPRRGQAVSRTVVVVTDGYVGVEAQAFRFIRERLDQANLFAFGIGSSVNRALIEGMARAGQGEPFVVLRPEKAAAEAERLRAYIEQPVLTRVAVSFDGFPAAEVSPAKVPDLMARRPLVVMGQYHGDPAGQIKIAGLAGGGAAFSRTIDVRKGTASAHNQALRWLWARSWVATLEDERHMGGGTAVEEAITDLGLRYSLLTPFTSFVATDQEVVNRSGQANTVRQPLPMPAGVPNSAVAAAEAPASAAPAPMHMPMQMKAKAGKRMMADEPLDGLMEAEKPSSPSGGGGRADRHHGAAPASVPIPTAPRLVRLVVAKSSALGLGDTTPLVVRVLAHLASMRPGSCPARAGEEVVVRLTVDSAGKVVAVDGVSGDTATIAWMRMQLVGLATATRATAKSGTFTITLRAV